MQRHIIAGGQLGGASSVAGIAAAVISNYIAGETINESQREDIHTIVTAWAGFVGAFAPRVHSPRTAALGALGGALAGWTDGSAYKGCGRQ